MAHYRYVALTAGILGLGCTDTRDPISGPLSPDLASTTLPAILVGAGDIAGCPSTYKDEATAKLLDGIAGVVFTLGDNAYTSASAAEYTKCYGPTWGRHRARTRPALGNHEYHTFGAAGYFGYFGDKAGSPDKGYYSYDLGEWHIVVLNSERYLAAQATWLKADLAANPRRCTLAYWHKPYFTTGINLPALNMKKLLTILYDAGAEIVVSGHNHVYERYRPQNPNGVATSRGIRYFVVGTGGTPLTPFGAKTPNLQVRQNWAHGVIKFSLYPTRYRWEFIPVAGKSYKDSGGNDCH